MNDDELLDLFTKAKDLSAKRIRESRQMDPQNAKAFIDGLKAVYFCGYGNGSYNGYQEGHEDAQECTECEPGDQ